MSAMAIYRLSRTKEIQHDVLYLVVTDVKEPQLIGTAKVAGARSRSYPAAEGSRSESPKLGLADARAGEKTLLRLRVILDEGGWTLTRGAFRSLACPNR
jgi:hypothetical protein